MENACDFSRLARFAHSEPDGVQLLPCLAERRLQVWCERGDVFVPERRECLLHVFNGHLAIGESARPVGDSGVYSLVAHTHVDAETRPRETHALSAVKKGGSKTRPYSNNSPVTLLL